MNILIALNRNTPFEWVNNDYLYVKGYIYDENDKLFYSAVGNLLDSFTNIAYKFH